MGGGVTVFDYNNDGLLDIFVVNGATYAGTGERGSAVLRPPIPQPWRWPLLLT